MTKFSSLLILLSMTMMGQFVFSQDSLLYANEPHFKNIRQLTFGGDNAEAYFSFDGKWIIYQKTNPKEGIACDQIFIGKVPTKQNEPFVPIQISNGKGRTTCGAFLKDGKHVVYASTHLGSVECPPVPDRSKYGNKYIWPLYDSYDIFLASHPSLDTMAEHGLVQMVQKSFGEHPGPRQRRRSRNTRSC